jgi:hypothetical protein
MVHSSSFIAERSSFSLSSSFFVPGSWLLVPDTVPDTDPLSEFLDSSHTFPSIPNVETMRCVSPCGHRLADLHRTGAAIAVTPTRGGSAWGRPAREIKGFQTGIPWAVAEFSSGSPNYRE